MIGIIQYGAGNIFSLSAALKRLGLAYELVESVADFHKYDRFIIPGVGHAGMAMQKLRESGMSKALLEVKKPVLGICVGMQLLTRFSEEGQASLLNLFPLQTKQFDKTLNIKIPHMGWNRVKHNASALFKDIEADTQFYFVHSYFVEPDPQWSIAECFHGQWFAAGIHKDNFYGLQFHPEKSGMAGEQILMNFSTLKS